MQVVASIWHTNVIARGLVQENPDHQQPISVRKNSLKSRRVYMKPISSSTHL